MNSNNMNLTLLAAAIALLPSLSATALADGRGGTPLMVNPAANARPGAAATGSVTRSGWNGLSVRLINSCYGTNLRGVANPLSPSSNIEARLHLVYNASESKTPKKLNITVHYPAAVVTKDGITDAPDHVVDPSLYKADIDGTALTGLKMAIHGNLVTIEVPPEMVTLEATGDAKSERVGTVTLGAPPEFIQHITSCTGGPVYGSYGYSSTQPTYPCGAYMGHEGALTTGTIGMAAASDNSAIDLSIPFPGQTGFCGGFYSPLMLFFDQARPQFSGSSSFKLSMAGKTFWVEPNAPGYFLAYDRNHNGKIDGKEELFGDQDSDQNGFDALKELDSNHDGVIDGKDSKWKDLVLWQDKNGDGISQDGEIEALSKRVTKISLKFKRAVRSYGEMAQARQTSEFWFRDKGKTKKGVVEDVWFAPLPEGK